MWKFKLIVVCATAIVVGGVIYHPFLHSPWSTLFGIIGICAGYTVIVFGMTWSVDDDFIDMRNAKPARAIFLVHCLFLGFVAEVVNFGLYIRPSLPVWLVESSGTGRRGRPTASAFDLFEMVVLVASLLFEFVWLRWNMPRRAVSPARND